MNHEICHICKSEIKLIFTDRINARMRFRSLCFNCNHWDELALMADHADSVRFQGRQLWIRRNHTHIGEVTEPQIIKFKNGRMSAVLALDFCGDIPTAFKLRLPENVEEIVPLIK